MKIRFILLLFLITLTIFTILYFNYFNLKSMLFNVNKIVECEDILIKKDYTYVLCKEENGKIVEAKENVFKPGDYISVQVNLQKLNIPYEIYHVCASSNVPISEIDSSKVYKNIDKKKEDVSCAFFLNKNDYHHAYINGIVKNKKGEYYFKVSIFNSSLEEDYLYNNWEKGDLLLDIKIKVE
ncbi:MAG: hypothetical protein KQA41_04215 [Candidatus Aenigmarchaeota archaeon]|nr:hypothetical protein [Candidatus Aenigmarchaeota archaeon]